MEGHGANTEQSRFLRGALPLLAGSAAGDAAAPEISPLAGDGSTRRLYRVQTAGTTAILVVNRLAPGRPRPDENEAFFAVRNFLQKKKLRVPFLYAADLAAGFLLLEDLGDLRLYDLVRRAPEDVDSYAHLYMGAIDLLTKMQSRAGPIYDPAMTSNPPYDEEFVLCQEAGYFHAELVVAVAGLDLDFGLLVGECRRLAQLARGGLPSGEGPGRPVNVFMHRDFQSRNLMVVSGELAVIDFQGARLGPPEYDLAALLYDPYVALPAALRRRLIGHYLRRAAREGVAGIPQGELPEVRALWHRRFLANAANRMMQALGAFAKLGVRGGRPGFREHIPTGLSTLRTVLEELGDCPQLLSLVARLQARKIH